MTIKKPKIYLKHKLQRPEGQWSKKMKSLLIDSLYRHYPVPQVYAEKQNNEWYVIDGVQRLSTIRDFLTDKFSLVKSLDPVMINNEEYNISGKKFSELPEDLKSELANTELIVCELTNCTEKDIREIFARQNSGVRLNAKLMRVVDESDNFISVINTLSDHPFTHKVCTGAKLKNGTSRDIFVQTMMLLLSKDGNDYTNFRNIDNFILNHQEDGLELTDDIAKALDMLNDSFPEKKVKIPHTSLPMVLYAGVEVLNEKKDPVEFAKKVDEFIANYNSLTKYKESLASGTSSPESVTVRFNYWKNIVKEIA